MDSWIFLLYLGLKFPITLFSCSNYSSFGHWQLFQLVAVPFWHIPIMWGFFFGIREGVILFSNTTWCSRFILFIPWPCPRISHFYKDTWVILLENGIINEDLGAKYANSYGNVCVSFLLGPLRWKSKEIYVCILIPT